MSNRLPVTVLVAAKNEATNIARCLESLTCAERVIVLDSHSTDSTAELSRRAGAEVIQFDYKGGYPKKRQWALDNLDLGTPWILLMDADECLPPELWDEIGAAISPANAPSGFLIRKGFHFLGRRFRFGGFSFSTVLLFRRGAAKFERLVSDPATGLDMEVHERLITNGPVGSLKMPLIHEDFKGLEAYIDRHNKYSTWEHSGGAEVSEEGGDPRSVRTATLVSVPLCAAAWVSGRQARSYRQSDSVKSHLADPGETLRVATQPQAYDVCGNKPDESSVAEPVFLSRRGVHGTASL